MQINDGEIFVTKSRTYENNYYTKELKKNRETGEYIEDENGKKVAIIKSVYLPEGTVLDEFSHIRFKGYTSFSINERGFAKEYIVITEILEVLASNNSNNTSNNSDFADDDLPF